jgi:glycerophosphoryl diester phosphodiesterase
LERVRVVGPNVACALLTFDLRDPQRTIDAVVAAGHVALHPWDGTVTHELVELVHAARLRLNVWTVDDPARILELAEMGVDGIVTNVPDVAAKVLRLP